MTAELRDIHPRADRQKHLRRLLVRSVRSALTGEVAGYALVTWNARGDAHTSYCTDSGPVGQRLMPAFVHDVLGQHVAVSLSEETRINWLDGK